MFRAANLPRGLLRLAAGSAAVWFVFWTWAYVLVRHASEMDAPSGPSFSTGTCAALAAAVIVAVPWIALGFRAD